MTPAYTPLGHYDWNRVAHDLDAEGWALLPGFFAQAAAHPLLQPSCEAGARRTLEALGRDLYPRLLPLARAWETALQSDARYPDDFSAWLDCNRAAGQTRPLSAVHRHRPGDGQALMQHADGEHIFALQLVALLSDPGTDFTGGEFVMTEQRPRMQSRPMVLPLQQGDAAVIAVSHRPVQGAHNVYRVTARQAISRVRSGERVGLEVVLHNGR